MSQSSLTVRSVSIQQICRGDNPRTDFDEAKLRDLAKSIQAVGLLEPILLRMLDEDVFELVAGERRFRAVQILEWQAIPAVIREMTDCEAAECRLLENLERENLNPIEEAAAFQQLERLGHSVKSLAALVRRSKASIETRLKLLELPEWWKEQIRRGDLADVAAEYLLPWSDCIDILDSMKPVAKQWPMLLTDWNRRLCSEVMAVSRSMEPGDADGPRFKASREQKASLDIRPLRIDSHLTVKRAMNTFVWDELQDLADRDQAPIVISKSQMADDPVQIEPAPPEALPPEAGGDIAENIAQWFPAWLRKILVQHVVALPVRDLLTLMNRLGIDPRNEWKLDREFLELHNDSELAVLADEIGVELGEARNRREILDVFQHAAPEQMPAAVESLLN